MTKDDLFIMAEQAGIRLAWQSDVVDPRNVYLHELERFAALVSAAEREACAKVCESFESEPVSHATVAYAIRARGQE